jgi:alkanesulfonate monooxygenase SsuD/methylene tetrahydromethanopterin reductase-like flavin-dependent oxidoreductase (luciferase family)
MTHRGFGIDATIPLDVVREVARAAEAANYDSFWLNGSPPRGAMEAVAAAAEVTSFPIGTGVLPYNRRSLDLLIDDARELGIPMDRFWMGIGWGGGPSGALKTMRDAVNQLRAELGVSVMVGAVGPNMTRLAAEISDGVIFTWWFKEAIEASRPLVAEGAERVGRKAPPVVSYIRCALLPQAQNAMDEVADRYDAAGSFRALFRAHGKRAHDTVVTGRDREELRPGIEREESVLDIAIIRAITADNSADSLLELLEACRPG